MYFHKIAIVYTLALLARVILVHSGNGQITRNSLFSLSKMYAIYVGLNLKGLVDDTEGSPEKHRQLEILKGQNLCHPDDSFRRERLTNVLY